ncbi:prolipoprotein diacylglyceryl transferase [Candidatus Peregrinibacteria bacterium CG_4_9_14_3_um_filter_49_12]|nr:MAG: prolipoprotein diacylglyceryl transferase [Candidatus Peregrinibacteria bacterium CG11_big_fil_rev_8_21_14_0_20_49_14]PJA68173.1 MAG: prolipoprotein diacylglyceryl transferase [Candidatus Peregrinibacteria bacterium CG_4_9_14_3_um_filter_49_12]
MFALFPSRKVALEIFGFSVHWYGLLYLLGFLLAFYLLPRLQRYRGLHLSSDEWSHILSAAIVGVLVGGRLGYVFFYAPELLKTPLEVLKVWHGGMSSHGGFIGVALALWWSLRKKNMPLLAIADTAVVPVAIGLALGRLGNFINVELYGTVTDVPWAMAIPGVEGLRHPLQFYGMAKDLFIASVCFVHLRRTSIPGKTFGLFLMVYGVLRFLLEYLRQQYYAPLLLGSLEISRGQLLTVPLFLLGLLLWVYVSKKRFSV